MFKKPKRLFNKRDHCAVQDLIYIFCLLHSFSSCHCISWLPEMTLVVRHKQIMNSLLYLKMLKMHYVVLGKKFNQKRNITDWVHHDWLQTNRCLYCYYCLYLRDPPSSHLSSFSHLTFLWGQLVYSTMDRFSSNKYFWVFIITLLIL